MSAIKFRRKLFQVYETDSPDGEVYQKNFIMCIKVSHMTRHSSQSNKLRNVNTARGRTGNVPVLKKENLLCQNQSYRAYHKFWMKQTGLKYINVNPKMGLRYQKHVLYLTVILGINTTHHALKVGIVNI